MAFAGASGPTDPVEVITEAAALSAGVPAPQAAWVGDALAQGAPSVVIVRADAVDADDVTEQEWTKALGKFDGVFGPGQVLIPGVHTAAAHAALLAHADSSGRTVLLDGDPEATAASLAASAGALAGAEGALRAGFFAPAVSMPGPGGVAREVPASVIVAGLTARGDSAMGHANNAPAGDQGRGAGVVNGALGVSAAYSDADLDSLHEAGVSVIRLVNGQPTLYGWRSVSADERFRQLNAGRMAMQLSSGVHALAEQFLFRQIDGQGHLYAELEGALRGYLLELYDKGALYGEDAAAAFDVEVADVNTPATAAAGVLHAAVAVRLSQHTEQVVINVVTSLATEGV